METHVKVVGRVRNSFNEDVLLGIYRLKALYTYRHHEDNHLMLRNRDNPDEKHNVIAWRYESDEHPWEFVGHLQDSSNSSWLLPQFERIWLEPICMTPVECGVLDFCK